MGQHQARPAALSARPSNRCRAGSPFGACVTIRSLRWGPSVVRVLRRGRARGWRPVRARRRPRRRRPLGSPSAFSSRPSVKLEPRGREGRRTRLSGHFRAITSRKLGQRIAPRRGNRHAASAICISSPSSSGLAADFQTAGCAGAWPARIGSRRRCCGSRLSMIRSRKRRRSRAGPVNRLYSAGVSQTMRT